MCIVTLLEDSALGFSLSSSLFGAPNDLQVKAEYTRLEQYKQILFQFAKVFMLSG